MRAEAVGPVLWPHRLRRPNLLPPQRRCQLRGPGSDGADHRPGAGPEQAAGNGALAGIVVGGCRQQQSGTDYAGKGTSAEHGKRVLI